MTLRYSVVVPVFNEAGNIGEFCRRARQQLPPGYELLVCYDQPEDDTLPALAALPADQKPEHIRLVHNTLGPGVRYAIEAGMKAAEAPVADEAPSKKAPAKKAAAKKAPAKRSPSTKTPSTKAPSTKTPSTKASSAKAPGTRSPSTRAATRTVASTATARKASPERATARG